MKKEITRKIAPGTRAGSGVPVLMKWPNEITKSMTKVK
jgi:hypothetical protein